MAYTSEIEKLERRVQENPQGRFFASLADAYRKDGQIARALEVLQAGLVIHPDYVSARVVLGRCLLDQGDDAGAEAAFMRVTELDAESVIALKALADIAERRGDFAAAAKWAGQLLTVDPGSDEAREQLARVEAQAGAAGTAAAPAAEAPAPVAELLDLDEPVAEATPAAEAPAPPEPDLEAPAPQRDAIRFERSADTEAQPLEFLSASVEGHDEPVAPAAPLDGVETTTVEMEPPMPVAPAAGLELTHHAVESEPAPLEGLEATAMDAPLELEPQVELTPSAATEFQEPSAAETLGDSVPAEPAPAPVIEPEPEPVVTEAMAVLYESQGHVREALAVYRELVRRSPDDARLAAKVAELEGQSAADGSPRWLATETGGVSVGGWFAEVLGARLAEAPTMAEAGVVAAPAAPSAPSAPEATPEPVAPVAAAPVPAPAPTRPAADSLSLSAIFGDETAPTPPAAPASGSFDDFFGGGPGAAPAQPPSTRTRSVRQIQPDEADLSQFQDWLKNLKK